MATGKEDADARLIDVGHTFLQEDGSPLRVLEGVNLVIDRGEFVTFLGPSGCGKTTLLRIIGGLVLASEGEVRVRGERVTEPNPSTGIVFQSPVLLPWRTTLGNVLFPMEMLGRSNRAASDRAHELLEAVGLGGFENYRPHQLSGGMQQRVALCRALIHEPTLLLMDEPFGALDELTRLSLNDLLLGLRRETDATIVFVTHGISEAVYLSDRVVVFSPRPAGIALELRTDLPYPRTMAIRHTEPFIELEKQAERALGLVRE